MTQNIDKLRDCPVLATVDAIGGKWRTRILWCLRDGPCRFGDLERRIGLSVKVLTQNLRALEAGGLICRTETRAGNSLMSEYRYTDYGRSLIPILDAMGSWGILHRTRTAANGDALIVVIVRGPKAGAFHRTGYARGRHVRFLA